MSLVYIKKLPMSIKDIGRRLENKVLDLVTDTIVSNFN
jgi:hypothetical protein